MTYRRDKSIQRREESLKDVIRVWQFGKVVMRNPLSVFRVISSEEDQVDDLATKMLVQENFDE